MDSKRPVVVAIDFSTCSGVALARAARAASWNNAPLIPVHVVNVPALRPIPPAMFPYELPTQAGLVASAREEWPAFARDALGDAFPALEVLEGNPRERLVDLVREHDASLLVIGASGRGRARGLGTVASGCVRRSTCPVLVVRESAPEQLATVAAFVDFSPASREALAQAVRFASQDDAEVHVVHAYDDPWHGMPMSGVVEANMPDFAEKMQTAVEQRLREFAQPLAHELAALKAQYHGFQHDAKWEGYGRGLVGFVARYRVDLAVLGVRSRWNVRDALMGSTAERVFRDAGCSILAVHEPKTDAKA